ncbi:hypothetical protein MVES_000296 [Malassezia vespertilionis]|uniref:separase n=1 Tax=Malassezia vespertilionis TaxID=2020962 RepID=A0A2N1JGZ5_9BASI|nr:hypothetical protein MVES_000296 [Malassezia vespertilionis]
MDEIVRRIDACDTLDRTVVAALIAHTESSAMVKQLSLYTSALAGASAAGITWLVPRADDARGDPVRARAAKQVANAVLHALNGMLATNPRAKHRAPSLDPLLVMLDAFRIAMGILYQEQCDVVQVAPYTEALTELAALAPLLSGGAPKGAPASVRAPPSAMERMDAALCFAGATRAPSVLLDITLDTQAMAVQCALSMAQADDLPHIAQLWSMPNALQAWYSAARDAGHVQTADRVAYAVERAITQYLAPLPSSAAAFRVRMDTLERLACVAGLESEAFWDRVGRVCASAKIDIDVLHARLAAMLHTAPSALHSGEAFAHMLRWWARCTEKAARPDLVLPNMGRSAADAGPSASARSFDNAAFLLLVRTAHDALVKGHAHHAALAAVAEALRADEAPRADVLGALQALLHDAVRALPHEETAAPFFCACVAAAEHSASPGALCAEAVLALRVLSTHTFSTASPCAQDTCLAYMARAVALSKRTHAQATLLVYVSDMAFHYASKLYAAKMYAPAAHFAEVACSASEQDAAATALDANLAKKYHVLGSARQHLLQYAPSLDAYWHAIAAQPTLLAQAGEWASRMPIYAIFSKEPFALLASSVRAALALSAFSLLHAQDAAAPHSLARRVSALHLDAQSAGAVLEYAAMSLVPMLARDDAPKAYHAVLCAALACYSPSQFPLRHARVLLQMHLYDTLQRTPATASAGLGALFAAPPAHDAALEEKEALVCTYHLQCALQHLAQGAHADAAAAVQRACASTPGHLVKAHEKKAQCISRPKRETPPHRETRPLEARSEAPLLGLLCAVADAMLDAAQCAPALEALYTLARLAPPHDAMHASALCRISETWLALENEACALHTISSVPTPADPIVTAHTELCAAAAHIALAHDDDACALYRRAVDQLQEALPVHASDRVLGKGERLELQARAADVYAAIQMHRGHAAAALRAALSALRLRLRCAMMLAKAAGSAAAHDVFSDGARVSLALPCVPAPAPSLAIAALQWRCTRAIFRSYVAVSRMYARRGAIRDALAFAQESIDFAAERAYACEALLWMASLRAASGERDAALASYHAAHVRRTLDDAAYAAFVGAELEAVPLDEAHAAWEACQRPYAQWNATHTPVLQSMRSSIACASARTLGASHGMEALRGVQGMEASIVRAQLALHEAEIAMKGDPVWAALPEIAYAFPGVQRPALSRTQTQCVRKAAPLLCAALDDIRAALASSAVGDVRHVRAALETAARIRTMQSIAPTRQVPSDAAAQACAMLDAAVSVAVRRACVDAAARRALGASADWFALAASDSEAAPRDALAASLAHDAALAFPQPPLVPTWAALTIALSPDKRELLVARVGEGASPSLFVLPMDRQSVRDGDETHLSLEAVLAALHAIVDASNASVQLAKDVGDMDARKAWWTKRRALDAELGALLAAVQDTWLGAFQGLFCAHDTPLGMLRTDVERILRRVCFPAKRNERRVIPPIPDTALACLAALPPDVPPHILEDWAHYSMDAFQLAGVTLAQDEVDLDVLCVDLRRALEEHHGRAQKRSAAAQHHLFLILDRSLCAIPWESLPVLRHRAVSRIPTLAMLYTHLAQRGDAPHLRLDPRNTGHLLNPSADLTRSEARFAPMLAREAWHGIVARAPVLDEMATLLTRHDTFLYFGHSGAEAYMPATRLSNLPQCAVSMLWGCSSGALRLHGTYEPSGTPYDYLVARAPALLVSLWDTTDRELDGICEAVLRRVGLVEPSAQRTCLSTAVASARDACKLPYLTGAACVVYGVPVVWEM